MNVRTENAQKPFPSTARNPRAFQIAAAPATTSGARDAAAAQERTVRRRTLFRAREHTKLTPAGSAPAPVHQESAHASVHRHSRPETARKRLVIAETRKNRGERTATQKAVTGEKLVLWDVLWAVLFKQEMRNFDVELDKFNAVFG